MSRPLMAARCPTALGLGPATLRNWRFLICPAGYGSIQPQRGAVVHGVLWRLTVRDLAAIDAYESVGSGLFVRRIVPVRRGANTSPAWVYVAGCRGEGTPRPSYVALVAEAARDWELPARYIASLQRWSPSGWCGAHAKATGELG